MDAIPAYQENKVATESSGRIIVMLYEGALKFLRQTLVELEKGDMPGKGVSIGRATDIINELMASLDIEGGGEIAVNLRDLYEFMVRHLTQANFKCDPVMVRDVIDLLEDLNDGWKAIVE